MQKLVVALTIIFLSLIGNSAQAFNLHKAPKRVNPFHQKISLQAGLLTLDFKQFGVTYGPAADLGVQGSLQLLDTPIYGLAGAGLGFALDKAPLSAGRVTLGIGLVLHRWTDGGLAFLGKAHLMAFSDNKALNNVPVHLVGSCGATALISNHWLLDGAVLVGDKLMGYEAHVGYAF